MSIEFPTEMWQHILSFMIWPGTLHPVCRITRKVYQDFAAEWVKQWEHFSVVSAVIINKKPIHAIHLISRRFNSRSIHKLKQCILSEQNTNNENLIKNFKKTHLSQDQFC